MELGSRLKSLRNGKGLSREEVATKLKISYWTISKHETGKRAPDNEMIKKYADLYGVTTDFLLGRIDNHNSIETDMDDIPPEGLKYFRKLKKLSPTVQKQFMESFRAQLKIIEELDKEDED